MARASALDILSARAHLDPSEFGAACRSANFRQRMESEIERMKRNGLLFRTNHLRPSSRNILLQGGKLTTAGANDTGAFNGQGPSVVYFMARKHGIHLEYPSAPCFIEPGGRGARSFFPLELIHVIPPPPPPSIRIAPRGQRFDGAPLPAPRAQVGRAESPVRGRREEEEEGRIVNEVEIMITVRGPRPALRLRFPLLLIMIGVIALNIQGGMGEKMNGGRGI
jgi:hypothetical protein